MFKYVRSMLYRATHDLFFYIAAGLVVLSTLFIFGNMGKPFRNHVESSKDKNVIVKYEEEDPLLVSKSLVFDVNTNYHNVPGQNIKYIDSLNNLNTTNLTVLFISIVVFLFHMLYGVYFFGDFFTKGGIRNMLAAGATKRSIFLASVIANAILQIMFSAVSAVSMVIMALIQGLYPIIHLPTILTFLLALYLIGLVFSSLMVLVVFVTQRPLKALIIVIGGAVLYCIFIGAVSPAAFHSKYKPNNTTWQKFRSESKEHDMGFEWYLPVNDFNLYAVKKADGTVYNEFITDVLNPEYPGDTRVAVSRLFFRLNITNIIQEAAAFYVYPMYRDGVLLRYIVVSSVYLCLVTALGSVVVKRRDII